MTIGVKKMNSQWQQNYYNSINQFNLNSIRFLFSFRPKSGSMLLYSRKKVRYRRDGYCWKKRKDGKTTREDHMKLKVQGTEVSNINNNFLHHSMFICQSQHLCSGKKNIHETHKSHYNCIQGQNEKKKNNNINNEKSYLVEKPFILSSFHPPSYNK